MDDLLPVALCGGTGFTGRRVAERLARRGASPVVLVRSSSDVSALPPGAVPRTGDLGDLASVDRWLAGCRSLVWCASMGKGHVPGVVDACRRAGIGRTVFVSTTAIFTSLPAPSKRLRQEAEAAVLRSDLRWTILRPTMIYGAPGDRNVERLLGAVKRWAALPVPGSGRALVQPVHADDVADAVVAAWANEVAVGRAYDLSGAAPLTLLESIDAAAAAVGRRPIRIRLPIAPTAWVLRLAERLGMSPRIRAEQVLRLAEDKAFPHEAAARDLGFAPRTFADGVREEARLLGLAAA